MLSFKISPITHSIPTRSFLTQVLTVLKEQVSPVIVNGYRKGEGIDPDRYPTKSGGPQVSHLPILLSIRQVCRHILVDC